MTNVIYYFILFILSFMTSLMLQKKDVSLFFKKKLYPSSREVLSTLETKFSETSPDYKIVKIKDSGKILLEIFKKQNSDWLTHSEFIFEDRYDGYFNHNSSASNLFLRDLDGDNSKEIVIPSFDSNFNARVNVIKYNINNDNFERLIQ